MPILAGPAVEPPPSAPPPPVFLPDIGLASATYYDPSGTAWPLTDRSSDRGWFTLADGVSGLGAAPVQLSTDPYPRGGARVRHIQPQSRTVVWPLVVYGSTHLEFLERWRALARALTDTSRYGPGILEIARPDGSRRQISVYYQEGWDGQSQQGYGRVIDTAAITWFCEDPYWFDPVPVTDHRESGAGISFLSPYPQVSSSQVLGDTTLANPGDVTAWPVWTITGPATTITCSTTYTDPATGLDVDESFTLTPSATGHGNLMGGEKVTVRTNPMQVRYQNGDVWTAALNWPDAQLWGLRPGANDVTFTLSGAGAGSAVDVAFEARYETA